MLKANSSSKVFSRYPHPVLQALHGRRAIWLSALILSGLIGWAWITQRQATAQQALLNINTIVGSGGGSTGLVAQFNNAQGIAAASATVFYVADKGNHVVRKVDTAANTVTIFAGQLGQGAASTTATNGDGGMATQALLNSPSDVALDAAGNVYISDTGNRKIRRVSTTGTITTFAGNGVAGTELNSITGAIFNEPQGLVFNTATSSFIVADAGNHRVLSLNPSGNPAVTLLAGSATGQSGLSEDGELAAASVLTRPVDVALSGDRVVIAESGNHRVRTLVTEDALRLRTLAGSGTQGFNGESGLPTAIQLNGPTGVSADANFVYIADTGNHRVRSVNLAGTSLLTIAGRATQGYNGDGSPASSFSLNTPRGLQTVTISGQATVLLMDAGNSRLRKVAASTLTTIVSDGSGGFSADGTVAANAKLDGPTGFAIDAQGNWYIADANNQVVRRVNASDGKIYTYAGMAGLASASATDANGDGGAATMATLNGPTAVAVDAGGNVYIADTGNRRIRRVSASNQTITTVMGRVGVNTIGASDLNQPTGIAVDTLGIYVADAGNHVVIGQNTEGSLLFRAGAVGVPNSAGDGGPVANARFRRPTSVAVSGPYLYVSDTDNHRVRRIERITSGSSASYVISSYVPFSTGTFQILVREGFEGDGQQTSAATKLRAPEGVATDPAGNLYISDRGNNRIRRVDLETRVINTIVGSGAIGFGGDGGPAVNASLGSPLGVFATNTNVFIADTGNNRIRRTSEQPNAAPVLTSPGNKTVSEGATLSFTLSATDTVGQTLTYSMTSNPALPTTEPNNATINASTGAFSWTPGFDVVAGTTPVVFNVTFTATDSGNPPLADSKAITITVNPANRPPVVDSGVIPATVEATGPNGAVVQMTGSATDPDNDAVASVVWTNTRPNQQPVTIGNTLTINPTLALGAHSIVLTVTTGTGAAAATSSSQPKPVTIQDTTPPAFSGTPSDITETITTGNSKVVNFTLPTATDLVSGARTVTATPPSGTTFPLGTTTVTLSTSDAAGNTRTATFRVIVNCNGTGCAVPNTTNFNMAPFAGNGNYGNSGDGGQGTAASFRRPRGIAIHANGNAYIADELSHQIRLINASGVISLLAGAGKGFSGDGAAAVNGRLNSPTGLAVDSTRNLLFVADTGNNRIRQIDLATGNISTIAGNGLAGIGADGPATSTPLNGPQDVAVDSAGIIYIADTGNNRILRLASGNLTTLSGNGSVGFAGDGGALSTGRFNHPSGIAVSSDGLTIYLADRGNNRIRRINNNTLATVAGTGAGASSGDGSVATAAGLNNPIDVMVDPAGNLFITEADGERIRRLEAADNKISTIAGNGTTGFGGDDGPGTSALLNTPTSLARNSGGVIFFCDTGNLRIRRLTPSTTNGAPVPDTVVNQSLNKSQSTSVSLSATDAEGDPVTFTLVPALSFVTVTNANPAARTASLLINPAGSNVGVYTVRVQASDNKGATGLTPEFTITINDPDAPPNRPPIARMNTLSPTYIAPVNATAATVNLDGSTSSDPDGDPLTYEWYDGLTKIATGAQTAVQLIIGAHAIHLEVVDNKGLRGVSATQNITVSGNSRNNAPVALAKRTPNTDPIVTVPPNIGEIQVGFDGTMSTDPDNDQITLYEWFKNEEAAPFATGATITATLQPGFYTIKLRVTDSRGAQSEFNELMFTIEAPPPDVVVSTITPNNARRGATVNVVVTGTGFTAGSRVSVNGGGVNATTVTVTPTRITATLQISSNALTGLRAISVNDLEARRFGTSETRIFTITP